MKFGRTIALLFISVSVVMCSNVTIFTEKDFKGYNLTISSTDYSNCLARLPNRFMNNISSINSGGGCANLYREPNCVGEYLEIKPGSPAHEWLYWWRTPSGEPAFDKRIQSIGPCTDFCQSNYIQKTPKNTSNTITVYYHNDEASYGNETGFTGDSETINIVGCVRLIRKFNPYAAAIRFVSKELCIELYKSKDCTEPFTQRRSSSSRLFVRQERGWNADIARALSLCDYNCPLTRAAETPVPTNTTLPDQSTAMIPIVSTTDENHASKITAIQLTTTTGSYPTQPSSQTNVTDLPITPASEMMPDHLYLLVFLVTFLLILLTVLVLTICSRHKKLKYGVVFEHDNFQLL